MSNQLKIAPENISFDWEPTTPEVEPGMKINKTVKVSEEVYTRFFQSFRELITIGMKETAKTSLGAAGSASSELSFNSETEFNQSYERQVTKKFESETSTEWTVPEGAVVGTLISQVDAVCGGLIISIPLAADTRAWKVDDIIRVVGERYYTEDVRMATNGKLAPNPKYSPAVYQPVVGETCHHMKFKEPKIDNCHVDGSNCVELDGKQFVVCHHRKFHWIGGADCNCSRVDNANVIIRSANGLNEDYYPA